MKVIITILFGFILFQAELADGTKAIFRMCEKSGKLWVIRGDADDLFVQEIKNDPLFEKIQVQWNYQDNKPLR